MSLPCILLLEDNSERIERFRDAVLDSTLEIAIWCDANAMIREVAGRLPSARIISLDHDLERPEGKSDPGDGLMVGKYLVSQPVKCPVIIHSSNTERSNWMAGEFELAGWPYCKVAPIGDDWIEVDWRRVVKRLLQKRPKMT
jgi:hypothetical protein